LHRNQVTASAQRFGRRVPPAGVGVN